MHWKRITLAGVGLLGGSLGLALRQRRLAERVVGLVRRPESARECERLGAVDEAVLDVQSAVSGADLIVLCTPIAQMQPMLERMRPFLKRGTIVTDVGSAKTSVVHSLAPLAAAAGAHFVGSHPMAGAEKTGVAAARGDLFQKAVCVVTPEAKSSATAVRKVKQLWKDVGARLLVLSPEDHDMLVSRSSHLPHLVAAALANLVLAPGRRSAQDLLCANGFRDTTRIASGSPEMWRDIALSNRKNLLQALDAFERALEEFRRSLARGDAKGVSRFFEQARERRDEWSRKAASASPE